MRRLPTSFGMALAPLTGSLQGAIQEAGSLSIKGQASMMIVLIHWRIKPEMVGDFLDHWKTQATIGDRKGLITEMLSEVRTHKDFWYATWSLDPESLGDFKSYVNVGFWYDDDEFQKQIADKFNDDRPLLAFEMYRRRRAILTPATWRRGQADLPAADPAGVL